MESSKKDITLSEARRILDKRGVSRMDYKHLPYDQQKKLAKGEALNGSSRRS